MKLFWTFLFLPLLLSHVLSLQCYTCEGNSNCMEIEACQEYQERCRTTVIKTGSSRHFQKGCDVDGKANHSMSYVSNNQLVSLGEEHCETDLCNKEIPNVFYTPFARGPRQKVMRCYSCSSVDKTCSSSNLFSMNCASTEDNCIDITSFAMAEEFSSEEEHMKGCGQLSHCPGTLGFHNHHSYHLIKCCNSSLCNVDTQDYKSSPLPLNGVTCYSCMGNATEGCSPGNLSQVQCQGPMTQCLEASGIDGVSGQSSEIKGCASASWCDSPYTAIYKNLGAIQSHCCSGNLCNNQIVNGILRPSARSRANREITAQQTLLSTSLLLSVTFLLSSGTS